ncbi:MAG: MiaB/RimO family radical SAM methylthiotransferase [Kiritimatiellaeota bacterium]|nr:MiaB/RimO family radical SAM methylthiotransferase [Kiritimatiellota bacterium]
MTFFLRSFGCRLNQAEGSQVEAAFEGVGFRRVPSGGTADVIIINSCAVTQKAEAECMKLLRRTRATQPEACIVLTGCATETCKADALCGLVDVFVPQSEKDNLLAIVMRRLGQETAVPPPAFRMPRTQRAAIKVQDGCPFGCAYCVVPAARGNVSRSRPLADCLAEARALIDSGFQEIVVTGCNTACYQDEGNNLVDLLRALLRLPWAGRIRLGSIEPGTVERGLLALMKDEPRICPFLHLPVQSGDDTILRLMRRRYMIGRVRQFLDVAYTLLPGIAIGTDLIAGFPGETEDAFANTLALAGDYPFANIHVFPYSERPHTAAVGLPGPVAPKTREQRARALLRLAEGKRADYMTRFVGRPVTVLVERYDPHGRAIGWSAEYLPCAVAGAPSNLRRTLLTFTPAAIKSDVLVNA